MADTDTASKVIDLASKKMDELGTQLSQLAHQYGPDVVNSALQVARIDAAQESFKFIIWFICLLPLLYVWQRIIRWDMGRRDDGSKGLPTFLFGLPCAALTLAFIIKLSIWPFVGVFEPKLWIAHKLLNLG